MKKMDSFEDKLREKAEQAEKFLEAALPAEQGYQKTVLEAMNYSVQAGGKRLRPIIMRAVYDLFGGRDEKAVGAFMCALEMIHTYSLVHDDLPAMDNDDYRRGKLTTHRKYGEAMGILTGDALLNFAYETAFQAFDSETPPERVAAALRVLGNKAGIYGLVGGQVVDVEKNGHFVEEETLFFVYRTKTAALLEAAFLVGGMLAGASENQMEVLEQTGRDLGLAFQIQDDILDVAGDEKKLGKPIRSDEKNEKSTYAAIHGLEASAQKVREYTESALQNLNLLPGDKTFLTELMTWLIDRDN